MADDRFDLLIKVRDTAEVANGNAQAIITDYRRKPDFSDAANSTFPQIRRAQERAEARGWLVCQHGNIKRLHDAKWRFFEGTDTALDLIRQTIGLRVQPIYVDRSSYPTAHEAAVALGGVVLAAWERAGGYNAVKRAPDRMHAEYDGHDADIAIEVSVEIWKRLRRLGKNSGLPRDLWGQIQQEFEAAWDRLEAETAADEGEPFAATPSISRDEANQIAMRLAKQDAAFVNGGVRQWAAAIRKVSGKTCSTATVKATRLWQATMKETGRGRTKGKAPKAVALTEKVGAVIGESNRQEALENLRAQQEVDHEPSPLDDTRQKVRHYRQV
ncbi:MAG TPA: hypothetical protein VJL29_15675 [Thermoguttaceae bacterium]|nr:hypothetical protein [Thermoguttaceae bacterium]